MALAPSEYEGGWGRSCCRRSAEAGGSRSMSGEGAGSGLSKMEHPPM